MRQKINVTSWIPYLHCSAPLHIEEIFTVNYFKGVEIYCPTCSKTLDWWSEVLHTIQENFMFNQAFAPIGAKYGVFRVQLESKRRTKIKFSDYGIPADAKLLHVNYTPQGGGLFPLEVHCNVPIRHLIPNEITLYPIPFGNVECKGETEVAVYVTWIPNKGDDESWQNLVDAFEAYAQNRYNAAIIPANVAVESKLARLLKEFLRQFAGKEHVENFLENGATYSHQVNVVLPLVVSRTNVPRMPDHIRGPLNRLRVLRNQLAHDGKLEVKLEKNDAAELLCTALFGFRYLQFVKDELLDQQSNNPLPRTH